jgi:hypothetical protein
MMAAIDIEEARNTNGATAADRPFLTVVSGLPRSGTSLMMSMLDAGGLPVLVDNIRAADYDNPRGYYEYEPVKALKSDATWVARARGQGVKMVYLLVYDLPPDVEYRVLFMQRNLDEVLASQRVMLERLGKPVRSDDRTIAELFRRHLAKFVGWVKDRPNFRVLNVDYNAMVRDPEPVVAEIIPFLGGGLDADAMIRTVDPSLYRNRSS